MSPNATQTRRLPRKYWWGLAALAVVSNFYSSRLSTVPPDVAGVAAFAAVAAIALAIDRIGVRHTLFALLPTALLLFSLEVGVRTWAGFVATPEQRRWLALPEVPDLGVGPIYLPHHYALYNLNPEIEPSGGLRHNSLGLRDARELDPEENAIRIVFIGGSTTYTIKIRDNQKIFSYGLEQRLNAHFAPRLAGTPIQVVNAGMGGATSAENLIRMLFMVSEVRPDVIVIQQGINDGWPRTTGDIQSDYGNYRKRWEAPSLYRNRSLASATTVWLLQCTVLGNFVAQRTGLAELESVYRYTNRKQIGDPEVNVPRNSTRFFERNTRYMIAIARAMGASVLLLSEPTTERAGIFHAIAQEHSVLLEEIARGADVPFFDFRRAMTKDDTHMPDGVHVSQVGSDLKRDLLFRALLDAGIVEALIQPADSASQQRGALP